MLGDLEALVVEATPVDIHGVRYVDLTVSYPDRSTETARIGMESVPADLQAGERVLVSKAVNVIVAVRKA